MSRIKIVVTIGPKTNNAPTVSALLAAGMDVARLNGSHGDLNWHAQTVATIRSVNPDVPILLDIPGRKIRTQGLQRERPFDVGDRVVFTTEDIRDGSEKVLVTSADLHERLSVGAEVLANDGALRFTVTEISGHNIVCRAETAGVLRNAKGINVPSAVLKSYAPSKRDAEMLSFAQQRTIDFIGLSFVDSAKQVQAVRKILGSPEPRILSKVENLNALNHLEEVIEASDAIMIDRGDLSAETNVERIALYQKRILGAARAAGKPAIVATEMLHSMIEHPTPTKAEVCDISNAVLDGTAALMLSGETAIGHFPIEAVKVMRRVADTVSASLHAWPDQENGARADSIPQAMGDALALICRRLPVTKIVAITISGFAARTIAGKVRQPILAVSNDPSAARSFNLFAGTEGVHVNIPFSRSSTDHILHCLQELWRRGKLEDEDMVLVTSVGYPKSGNRMNLIQTHSVADLKKSQGWIK